MPSQDPQVRNKNFQEVALGYTEEGPGQAARCLHCKNHPCVRLVPSMSIPEFIAKIVERDYEGAYQVIHRPAPCRSAAASAPRRANAKSTASGARRATRGHRPSGAVRGRLAQRSLHRHRKSPFPTAIRWRSSAPARQALTCAGDLAKKGYEVHGVRGVPPARRRAGVRHSLSSVCPRASCRRKWTVLKAMGVESETNTVVIRTITIDELMEENGFEAVFIGSGAGLPMFMNIPGVNYKGVLSANEFLTRINLMKAYREDSETPIMDLNRKKVAVVGGGNVAMDAARFAPSARRRRVCGVSPGHGGAACPSRRVEHAIEEGVIFKTLNNPVQINGDERDCPRTRRDGLWPG